MQKDELRDSDHARSEHKATDIDVPAAADNDEDTRIDVELDLDNYVLEWFQAQGENYEDLMNQVLRDYIEAEEAAAAGQAEPDADGDLPLTAGIESATARASPLYLCCGPLMEFEWDEAKRLSNIQKHRIDFD